MSIRNVIDAPIDEVYSTTQKDMKTLLKTGVNPVRQLLKETERQDESVARGAGENGSASSTAHFTGQSHHSSTQADLASLVDDVVVAAT